MVIRSTLVAVLIVGAAMIVFGGKQLLAALLAAPGDPIVAALNDDRSVGPAAMDRLVETRRAAIAWNRSPRYLRDYGRAAWVIARAHGADRELAQPAYQATADVTEDGLRIAPVDPVSWLRLAAIRLDVDEDPDAALTALRAAVRTGPYDPFRTEVRVVLILQLWPRLTASDRSLFQPQFDYLWDDDPDALLQIAGDDRAFLVAAAMLSGSERAEAFRRARDPQRQSPQ